MGNLKISYGIRLAAGLYLLYIGYDLAHDVIKGEASSPWLLLAGVVFLVFGAFFVYSGYSNMNRLAKEEKEAAEAEMAAQEEENADEVPQEPKKPMSISERARLADNVDVPEGLIDEIED